MRTRPSLLLLLPLVLLGCEEGGTLLGPPGAWTPPPAPRVVISEIHYNPPLEDDPSQPHEFVELHNAGTGPADLTGWSFEAGLTWVFDERSLEPGGVLVLAKNRARLLEVHPGLPEDRVLGDFEGRLSDGGETLRLVDAEGDTVDEVEYSDAAPWPLGADALGAGDGWLPDADLPVEAHRFLGRSLLRVALRAEPDDPGNWIASDLDDPSPGRAERYEEASRVVVLSHALGPEDGGPLLPGREIPVRVALSGPTEDLRLEWFVDDLDRSGEPVRELPLDDRGDGRFEGSLPAQPEGTILRYRVAGDRGARGGDGAFSPRSGDPVPWYPAAVGEVPEGRTVPYRIYIGRSDWARMWTNIEAGRVTGCRPNPTWNDREAAVFVAPDGRAFDVRVRYQGSRFQRTNGRDFPPDWTGPRPGPGSPHKVLSWRVAFPRYAAYDGVRVFTLNKLLQACPGIEAVVGLGLAREIGVPAPEPHFARLFVNGAYSNYAIVLERPGEELLTRYHEEQAALHPDEPVEPGVGHLFKAVGCNCDEGPFGWGDGRLLERHCGYSVEERYTHTYDRKTHTDWGDVSELRQLIEEIHLARNFGDRQALRDLLAERFDLPRFLDQVALGNWAEPWDDTLHNYYLYQRLSDGKWLRAPWDLDLTFGGLDGVTTGDRSIWVGMEGEPDNRAGWWNLFKDALLRAYPDEYEARLRALNDTLLRPEAMLARIDAAEAMWALDEVEAAPLGALCDYPAAADRLREFSVNRHAFLEELLGSTVP